MKHVSKQTVKPDQTAASQNIPHVRKWCITKHPPQQNTEPLPQNYKFDSFQ